MSTDPSPGCLLALDPGVRWTGWAVFPGDGPGVATGVIAVGARQQVSTETRLSHLVDSLDALVERWRPAGVALCQPSGIPWRVPALALLEAALDEWSDRHQLPLYAYSAQELRGAITGQTNASGDELAYAVMEGLGLIGTVKSGPEWEALAVGHYHFSRMAAAEL